nr:retrovirus-related Pol polyprotein from transposon TNT 1-94 [Tanacetum cinerariifolium]
MVTEDNEMVVNVAGARENVGTQKLKRVKDAAYHKEKMLLCKQEEAGVQLNAEQANWKDDNDDESDNQELEAHYISQQATRNRGKVIVNTSAPIYDQEPTMVTEDNEMSKEKEIDKLMALISLYRGTGYENQRVVNVAGARENVGTQTSVNALKKSFQKEEQCQSFEALQKHAINLELALQQCKEQIKNKKSFKANQSNVFLKEREQYFEIQDLKSQLQDKGIAISELKKLIEKIKGKSVETKFEKSSVIRQPNAFKSQRQSVLGKLPIFSDSLEKTDFSIQRMYKVRTEPNQTRTPQLPQDFRKTNKLVSFSTGVILSTSISRPQLKRNQMGNKVMPENSQEKKQQVEDHHRNFKFSNKKTSVTVCNDSLNAKNLNVNFVCVTCGKCMLVEIILFIVDSGCSKHIARNLKLLTKFMEKFLGTVKFGNDQIAPILGYGDLVQGTRTIKRVYYVEGLNHNLFSISQFCDADLEVAFRKSTCYIRDLNGNDLLIGSRGTDLYFIILQETSTLNPICSMARATSSQAWLWHRCLLHLNFNTINLLSKNIIVTGLPKLKFVKDHLCSSCELGKAKRKSFHTKATPSLKRRLQLLHMDLYGPMRVESINKKKYVLVIVDDYSRYPWAHLLRFKDETPATSAVHAADDLNKRQQNNTTKSSTTTVAADTPPLNIQTTPETTCQEPTQAPTVTPTENINQAEMITKNAQVDDDEFINIFCTSIQEKGETSSCHQLVMVGGDGSVEIVFGKEKLVVAVENGVGTPMATKHLNADLSGTPIDQMKYRSMVGALMYLTASRSDIVHATCYCARYKAKPTEKHLTAVKRIFRYLKDTIHMGLWYPKDIGFELTVFLDLDHVDCLDSRKSTSVGIQFLGGDKLVSWSSKKQDCTSMSSAKAEYVSLSACCAQVL